MKLVLSLAAAVLLAGCAAPTAATAVGTAGATAPGPVVTTRGVGTVSGTPDTLTVVLGVQTRAPSATAALADNNARTAALLDVLRDSGVADADLRTTALSIHPAYRPDGSGPDGYEVTNEVTATLRDTAGAGALLDAAADAAGDAIRVQRITFSIGDDSEVRARARADAVQLARTQASQLAEAADVGLGPIVSITEVVTDGPVPFAAEAAAADAASAVPLEAGTQEVTVTVEVVHALDV